MRYTDINSMGGSEPESKPMQDAKKTKAKFEKSKTEDWVME
jgi:hypothetical protein